MTWHRATVQQNKKKSTMFRSGLNGGNIVLITHSGVCRSAVFRADNDTDSFKFLKSPVVYCTIRPDCTIYNAGAAR